MRPTIQQIKNWFVEYNARYFNNTLPIDRIDFGLSNRRKAWGDCKYPSYYSFRYRIRLSVYFDREEKSVRQTLIHEMIHVFCHLMHNERGHGLYFKRECARINKDGWKLSTSTSAQDTDSVERLPIGRYVFVFKHVDYPNKICVARATKEKYSYIYNALKRISKITLLDMKYSTDASLASLIDSRKNIRFNTYTPTEFKEKFNTL